MPKTNKQQALKDFYSSFGIANVDKKPLQDELLYKLYQKPKKEKGQEMPHFDNTVPNAIHMADTLYLPDDNGYKYCTVIVDTATHKVDAQPIKTLTSEETLKAMKAIYKRKILLKPTYMIITDSGGEFKSVVETYLKTNKILKKTAITGRHRQVALVEAMNKIIGKALHMRQTAQELGTNEASREWVEFLPAIIKAINKKLSIVPIKPKFGQIKSVPYISGDLLKMGDLVRVALDYPVSVSGNKRLHGKFRSSDIRYEITPRRISNVLFLENQPVMYSVEGIKHTGFTRNRLQLVTGKENKPPENIIKEFIPEKFLDKRKDKNLVQYLVKWKDYKKPDWNYLKDMINDTNKAYIRELVKKYLKR